MTAFWNVMSCTLVELARRFRCAYCLRNQGDGDYETLDYFNDAPRCYIPEDCHLHSCRREILKYYKIKHVF